MDSIKNYEIINDYRTIDGPLMVFIFESKRLDLPVDAPKSSKFQWYYRDIQAGKTEKLEFLTMEGTKRTFTDGTILDLNEQDSYIMLKGDEKHKIRRCKEGGKETMLMYLNQCL